MEENEIQKLQRKILPTTFSILNFFQDIASSSQFCGTTFLSLGQSEKLPLCHLKRLY